ncbi:MAG: ribonuclease D [Candidatus Puniceispirillum sp.]|nr:ribonuclease D [Candidatus Puniceispirillum sp.]
MDILTTPAALEAYVQRLLDDAPAFVAVDTEFERESTYWPKLCLVQVATPDGACVLIDPLAQGMDLAPLVPLLAHPHILKVFHAARQDVETLFHHLTCMPTPLFDTQIGAMLWGFGVNMGFEALVKTTLEVSLDKAERLSDWTKRPLTASQISYAAADVIYLAPAFEKMRAALETMGRFTWALEESAKLLEPSLYDIDPKTAWERVNVRTRNALQETQLRRLAAWRETRAKERNRPRTRILSNETLAELLAINPQSLEDFDRAKSLKKKPLPQETRQEIFTLMQEDVSPDEVPALPRPRPSDQGSLRAVLYKQLLAFVAAKHHIAPSLIATSKDIERYADDPNQGAPFLIGWRGEIFGTQVEALSQGRLTCRLHGTHLVFEP